MKKLFLITAMTTGHLFAQNDQTTKPIAHPIPNIPTVITHVVPVQAPTLQDLLTATPPEYGLATQLVSNLVSGNPPDYNNISTVISGITANGQYSQILNDAKKNGSGTQQLNASLLLSEIGVNSFLLSILPGNPFSNTVKALQNEITPADVITLYNNSNNFFSGDDNTNL